LTPAEELALLQLLTEKDVERCTPEVVAILRKLREYCMETIAEVADQVKEIDCLIEEANTVNVGDDGL
jgi:hypothetical protein